MEVACTDNCFRCMVGLSIFVYLLLFCLFAVVAVAFGESLRPSKLLSKTVEERRFLIARGSYYQRLGECFQRRRGLSNSNLGQTPEVLGLPIVSETDLALVSRIYSIYKLLELKLMKLF